MASNGNEVRVFVAATPAEWLPMRILEFSIREHTRLPVSVRAIYEFERPIPEPRDVANRPRTPFSFQRFLIPELCGFSGRAIYCDADMQLFQDISKLWNFPLHDCDLQTVEEAGNGRRGQFSVMLMDCARLRWRIEEIVARLDAGELDYAGLMYEMRVAEKVGRRIPAAWNSLERHEEGKTALLHYTDMNIQPWAAIGNPLGHLWVACLRRAITSGFISQADLQREVEAGHVRPSLKAQLDAGIDSCVRLPSGLLTLDRDYVAPYKRLSSGRGSPWTSVGAAIIARAKRYYYRSFLARWL